MNYNPKSIIFNVDAYKTTMAKQYPPGTQYVYTYGESRGGPWSHTLYVPFLKAFCEEYLQPVTQADLEEAEKRWTKMGLPFFRDQWQYIIDTYDGVLPITIRSAAEGSLVPVQNALFVIINEDPKCYWLTTWIETAILRAAWYPVTVATLCYEIRKSIEEGLKISGTEGTARYKLVDFGARGVSSFESSGIGGAAFLSVFNATDNMNAIMWASQYYGDDFEAVTIPAAEHSTITSWGRAGEVDAYRNMVEQFKSSGMLAVVSDSYDIFNAADQLWGVQLKELVEQSGATVVIRPDSGDPAMVVLRLLDILGNRFGYTVNSKGFKVLNTVRIIQGDGMNLQSIRNLINVVINNGWSLDNVTFGMGGALLQSVNRDTMKWAVKCSVACINDVWVDVQKDPITDSGKRSKTGLVVLDKNKDGEYFTRAGDWAPDVMEVVFFFGKTAAGKNTTMNTIRSCVDSHF